MEKETKFDVIKEKIIKTDELIRLFKQKSDDLQRISLINKQYKTRLELRKNEIDKTKLENDILTTRLKTIDSKYQTLHDEHEQLKHRYNELDQEYFVKVNDDQVKFQTVSQELVDCREKLQQYEKRLDLNELPPKKSSKMNDNNSTINKELNGMKLQYSMLEQEFKDLQKEHNLVVEALKKTENQLQKISSQTTKKESLKCDQKICRFYKELANIQLENYNLRREISDLRILEGSIDELRKLEQEHEAVQKELNGIKLEYNKKIQEIVSLNLKLDQFKLENNELKHSHEKNADNNKKIELLSIEIEALHKQKDNLLKENVDMKEKITKLSNEICEINATPSDSTIESIMNDMIVADIITPFENETELEDNRQIPKESSKLSTSNGDFLISNIGENLTIYQSSRNLNRRRKPKRIRNQLQNVDLLATLKALTESNIKFTISNESALTTLSNNFDFPIVKKAKLEKQKFSKNCNKNDFLTKKLDCNLECCNGISSYYIMKNDNLLGFLNIKNEITSNLFQEDFLEKYKNDKAIISHDCLNQEKSPISMERIETSIKKSRFTLRRSLRLSSHTSQDQIIDNESRKSHNCSNEGKSEKIAKTNVKVPKMNVEKQIILYNSTTDVEEYPTVAKKKRITHKNRQQICGNDKKKFSNLQQESKKQSKTSFKRPVCSRRRLLRSLSQLKNAKSINKSIQEINFVEIDENLHSSPTIDTATDKNVGKEPETSRQVFLRSSNSCGESVNDSTTDIDQESIENAHISPETRFSFKRPVCSRRQSLRSSNQLGDEISCRQIENENIRENVEEKSVENAKIDDDDGMNPQSPPPFDQGIANCGHLPKIIPLEKMEKIQASKVKVLIEKLINYSSEEKVLEEIVQQFTTQDPKYIAEIILDRVIADHHNKPDTQYTPPAPILTEIQRILLGFMVALEHNNVTNIYEHFLTLSERFLFFSKNLEEILAVTRFYLSVCKLRNDIHRTRKLCCEMFYFNYSNAIPSFYIILTSWAEVLPFESESKEIPLARILVQNVYISGCNQPGYNLLPLRDLLIKYYGYPSERWNSDDLFDELFNIYRSNPIRSSDFNLLLLCKNHPEKWLYEMIHKHLIPFIDQITIDNFRAAVIILIGNLSHSFSTNSEYLTNICQWMRCLITETTPDIVRRSVYLSLKRLMRRKKKKS